METSNTPSITSLNFRSYRTYEEWKLGVGTNTFATTLGSYRTYEEWKPFPNFEEVAIVSSSYRTYEEWKHWCLEWANIKNFSSYRTYEEWKLASTFVDTSFTAWFLPYLWGMETLNNNLRKRL